MMSTTPSVGVVAEMPQSTGSGPGSTSPTHGDRPDLGVHPPAAGAVAGVPARPGPFVRDVFVQLPVECVLHQVLRERLQQAALAQQSHPARTGLLGRLLRELGHRGRQRSVHALVAECAFVQGDRSAVTPIWTRAARRPAQAAPEEQRIPLKGTLRHGMTVDDQRQRSSSAWLPLRG